MSLIFEPELDGHPVQLEVTRDGELIFLDYDITHDLAILEFGYPETAAAEIHRSWIEDPIRVLLHDLSRTVIDNNTMVTIAIEWAEHVLPVYDHWNHKKTGPKDLLDASRKFLSKQIPYFEFMSLRRKLRLGEGSGRRVIHRGEGAVRARMAAHEASTTVLAAYKNKWSVVADVIAVALHGQNAVAYDDCDQKNLSTSGKMVGQGIGWLRFEPSDEFKWASQAERAWQIRRFVDVIEAVSQDLPWPPPEATP